MSRYTFHFSKQFFLLFILTTIVPLLLFTAWRMHSGYSFFQDKLQSIMALHLQDAQQDFDTFADQELAFQQRLLAHLNVKSLDQPDLKALLEVDQLTWSNKETPQWLSANSMEVLTKGTKAKRFYDISKTNSESLQLLTALPVRSKQTTQWIITRTQVRLNEIIQPAAPVVLRLYSGSSTNKESLLGLTYNQKLPQVGRIFSEDAGPFAPGPPLPLKQLMIANAKSALSPFQRENGRLFQLTGVNGRTVATGLLTPLFDPTQMKGFPFLLGPLFFKELLILGIGVIFSLIVGSYLKNRFIFPIQQLSVGLQSICDGDLATRVTVISKQQEIQELFDQFNLMAEGFSEKETLKQSFISNLTHDLKTPLIAEAKAFKLLRKRLGPNDGTTESLLEGLQRNNQHLIQMVYQLLDTYQFDEGRLTLQKVPIDLQDLLKSCLQQVQSVADDKKIHLEGQWASNAPYINLDASCISRCVLNLLQNALDHCSEGEIIQLTSFSDNYSTGFHIKDSGPGISAEQLPHLFDRYRTGHGLDSKVGSGLGLYICKALIEAHGGTLTVQSDLAIGTTFTARFPAEE